jgi:hypothetical protein
MDVASPMIEFVFTLDYEIYGNGEGSLRELVYEPTERLKAVFGKWKAPFVPFIEVAELEIIESRGTDPAIEIVRQQIRDFHKDGVELGLHIHPQWYNARYENEKWEMEYGEYNLCTLSKERITKIVDRSITYLRGVLGAPYYTPLSFRAGNWLFQPARTAARVLAERGIKVDSSVFKGGLRHEHGLDYRRGIKSEYYWRFEDKADVSDQKGILIEIPIYTQMRPFWKMLTGKRMDMERKGSSTQTIRQRVNRLLDILRFRHPLKLDFCRMTIDELSSMLDTVIRDDRRNPTTYKPIVAIGHTKELFDFKTIDFLLSYLAEKRVDIVMFGDIVRKLPSFPSGKGKSE